MKTLKNVRMSWLAVVSIVAYAAIAIASDLFANKMLQLGALTLAGGIVLIPFSFTIRDLIHRVIGFENVKKVVWATALVNLGIALLTVLLDALPAVSPETQEAWHSLMGASWRVMVGSFVGQIASQLTNTYVYEWALKKFGDKHVWFRTASSNLFAIAVDSVVFSMIAFAGVLPMGVVWASIGSSFVVKYGLSLLATPLAYLNEKVVKEAE